MVAGPPTNAILTSFVSSLTSDASPSYTQFSPWAWEAFNSSVTFTYHTCCSIVDSRLRNGSYGFWFLETMVVVVAAHLLARKLLLFYLQVRFLASPSSHFLFELFPFFPAMALPVTPAYSWHVSLMNIKTWIETSGCYLFFVSLQGRISVSQLSRQPASYYDMLKSQQDPQLGPSLNPRRLLPSVRTGAWSSATSEHRRTGWICMGSNDVCSPPKNGLMFILA